MDGIVFDIAEGTIHDGPGLRVTVFLKGCPLRCRWCHSPEGQRREPETLRFPDGERRCGDVWGAEVLGHHLADLAELADGVTFSGGEPLAQAGFLQETLRFLPGVHTIVETSGCCDGASLLEIDGAVSRIHYGLKIVDERGSEFWVGTSSQRMLDNLRLLDAAGHAEYRIRMPLIAGAVASDRTLRSLMELCRTLRRCRKIDFLPANRLAAAKYAACGREIDPLCRDCRTGAVPEWFDPGIPWSVLD